MSANIQKKERRLAARDARRAAQREAALQSVAVVEPKPKHWVTVVIGAGGTAIWFGLASWSYTAATAGDMIGAAVILAIAFLIAMGALLASERYGEFGNRKRLARNLSVAAGLAAISVALFWWEYVNRPAPAVTADDIKKALEAMRPNTQTKSPTQSAPSPLSNLPPGAIGVPRTNLCPPGYSIVESSLFKNGNIGISAPSGAKLCIVGTEFENLKKGFELR